ncbi:MAG: hypothetical protein H0W40_03720 [Methylibium sp.]|uniref:hypothetical protein n=1 Tax=Methylibium sp. TaxID=2067992 RepID=UPI0017923EF6|nr:hypothetical protein [Methylibium sp.]MBA3596469.1 hypothetical protein [Methylibium sp.]
MLAAQIERVLAAGPGAPDNPAIYAARAAAESARECMANGNDAGAVEALGRAQYVLGVAAGWRNARVADSRKPTRGANGEKRRPANERFARAALRSDCPGNTAAARTMSEDGEGRPTLEADARHISLIRKGIKWSATDGREWGYDGAHDLFYWFRPGGTPDQHAHALSEAFRFVSLGVEPDHASALVEHVVLRRALKAKSSKARRST